MLHVPSTYILNRGILLKAQLDRLNAMSETLESSGFSPQQSNAVIESVALAMETFAVTPEVLDQRIEKVLEEMRNQFASQNELFKTQNELISGNTELFKTLSQIVNGHGDEIKGLKQSVSRLEQTMLEMQENMVGHQRSMFRIMMVFVVLMLTSTMGIFGTFLGQFVIP